MRWWLSLVVAGCGNGHWFAGDSVEMDGQAWASPDGSSLVYMHGDSLVSVRRGIRHDFRTERCIRPDLVGRVFVMPYGRHAEVLTWESGNGTYAETACELDLETGRTTSIRDRYPEIPLDDFAKNSDWRFGARTGWLYKLTTTDQLDVFDLEHHATGHLPIRNRGTTCDVAETANTVVIACADATELTEVPPTSHPYIEVSELDRSVFPPVLIRTRTIDVPGYGVRISRDASRLVWWWDAGPRSLIGLVDLTTLAETIRFSVDAGDGVLEVDLSPDNTELAVAVGTMAPNDTDVWRYALTPTGPVKHEHHVIPSMLEGVTYLANHKIIVSGYQRSAVFAAP